MKIHLTLLCATTLLLPACGGDADTTAGGTSKQGGSIRSTTSVSATTPAGAATAFLTAAANHDGDAFEALLTEGARAGIASGGGGFDLEKGLDTFEIGPAELDGDEARVPVYAEVDGQRQDLKLCLREESGQWRIWGFDVVIGTETAMTIDLESIGAMMEEMESQMAGAFQEAFQEAAMGGSEEEIRETRERFQSLAAITEEEHDEAWRIRFEATGQPAKQVLTALLGDTNLSLDLGDHGDALETPISLKLAGVSRIEAFEAVCAVASVTPIYPAVNGWNDENQITFVAGERAHPLAFAGPFLIEIAELEEQAPNTTGSVAIAVRSLGLAPAVLAYQTEMVQMLAIESISAPDGSNVNADEGTQFWGTPTLEGAYLSDQTSLDLKLLLRGVTQLDITGTVRLSFPHEIQDLRWEAGETEPRTMGDLTCKQTTWGESPRFELSGLEDFEGYQVRVSPLDAADDPLGVVYTDSSSWGKQLQFGLQAAAVPASVEIKICNVKTVEYPFELREVPLASWADQPEVLEPLAFPEDAPLFAEYVRFTERGDFPKVELQLRNEANKDALQAQVTFFYLDASGKELENFSHTLTGVFGFDGQEPLALAGAGTTQEATAFFVPEGTESIRVQVDTVTFLDASEWTRPQ